MEKLPISLVIITLNEEKNIARCIQSAPWVSDIVVLDSGSRDTTVEKAKALGARTFSENFRGFREQKQRATDLAKENWVLSLDADEALSVELSREIQEQVRKGMKDVNAFEIPRLSFHLGRWIFHGGWYPDYQIRLFHRQFCKWGGGHVHERVTGENPKRFKSPIHHWVFSDLADQVDTNNEYSSKGALDLYDRKENFSVFQMINKTFFKFLETFVWKKGFLDGVPGLIIAGGAAYSVFLKYAKLWELQNKREIKK